MSEAENSYFHRMYLIDNLCDEFENELRSGNQPVIAEFVARIDEGTQEALLLELLDAEWEWLSKRGESPTAEPYVDQFPHWADAIRERFKAFLTSARKGQHSDDTDPYFGDGGSDTDIERANPQSLSSRHGAGSSLPADIDEFCEELCRFRIVKTNAVRKLRGDPESGIDSSADLCAALVKNEYLTPYQSEVLQSTGTQGLKIDHYTLIDRIGAGGMGEVFKARHDKLDRLVALKVISERLLAAPEALKRFFQEVRTAAQLSHPNIVTAYDAGEWADNHYLVMELVDGPDLRNFLRQAAPLPLTTALDYTIQIAEGLQYAHSKHIVHRDIKPANLLIDSAGQVKILDMGLAFSATPETEFSRLTKNAQMMGTVAYMAPEQAIDVRQADERSDIYSVGCTLYEMLTGQTPYSGSTHLDMILAHRDSPIPSLRESRPDVPHAVDATFQKMLAKDPADRFGAMDEVIAALRQSVRTLGDPKPETSLQRNTQAETTEGSRSSTREDLASTITISHDQAQLNKLARGPSKPRYAIVGGIVAILLMVLSGSTWGLVHLLSSPSPETTPDPLSTVAAPPSPPSPISDQAPSEPTPAPSNVSNSVTEEAVPPKEPGIDLQLASLPEENVGKLTKLLDLKGIRNSQVLEFAFTPDGATLYATELGGQVFGWDTTSGNLLTRFRTVSHPNIPISPSGDLMFAGGQYKQAGFFALPGGEQQQAFSFMTEEEGKKLLKERKMYASFNDAVFTPDGKTVFACDNIPKSLIYVFDVETAEVTSRFDSLQQNISTMEISPNGELLATCAYDGTTNIWNAKTHQLVHSLRFQREHQVYDLAFSKDSKILYTGGYNCTVVAWDTLTGYAISGWKTPGSKAQFIEVSAEGDTLLSYGPEGEVLRVWDIANETQILTRSFNDDPIIYVDFSPTDNALFAIGTLDGGVSIWRYDRE